MSIYQNFLDQLKEEGHFLGGFVLAIDESGGLVDSNGRPEPRSDVAVFDSSTNHAGVDNIFLSSTRGDLPAPAGTRPWIV